MYLNDKRKIRLHMKEAGFLLNHLNLTIKNNKKCPPYLMDTLMLASPYLSGPSPAKYFRHH